MKKVYIIAVISIFFQYSLSAQTEDIIRFILDPTSVFVDGDDLYFGLFNGELKKTQLSSPDSVSTVINSNGIYRSFRYGNDLYVTRLRESKISKIDITQANPTPIDVIENLVSPSGLVIQDDVLYFSESGQISKLNLSDSNAVKEVVCDQNLNAPSGICILGNDLYVAEFNGNRISKLDLTASNPIPETVVSGLNEPTEIITDGLDFYVSEFALNKVLKINAEDPTIVENLITNINNPTGLYIDGSDLYISVFGDSKIVRLPSIITSTTEAGGMIPSIVLYPNPSSDFIRLSPSVGNQRIVIHNSLGARVATHNVSEDQEIDIKHLAKGQYFLTLASGHHIGFIKQ